MVAVAKDELEVVQILLDQGVNVNQKYHQASFKQPVHVYCNINAV